MDPGILCRVSTGAMVPVHFSGQDVLGAHSWLQGWGVLTLPLLQHVASLQFPFTVI